MKNLYLPRHISRTLKVPVHKYKKEKPPVCTLSYSIMDFPDDELSNAVARSNVVAATSPSMPLILSLEGLMAWAVVSFSKTFWLIGPIRFQDPVYFSHAIAFTDLGLSAGRYAKEDFPKCVPVCSFSDFIAHILLLHNVFKKPDSEGHFLERDELVSANCVNKRLLQAERQRITSQRVRDLENGIRHNPYSQEKRECASIREGDPAGLKIAISETFTGKYGVLSDNALRHEINMGIVTITLASRAAIEGGLQYESAFTISDMTIRAMEASGDVETVRHIYRNAEYHLAELVKEINDQRKAASEKKENGHISRCKDYIATHLHEPLTVRDIAAFIHIDPSYLSSMFSRHERITLKQYIMSEKIRLVKNMLMYSSYSFIQIATYLGFCSQSHLGTVFKKETGMSLKEFRDIYAQDAFRE